MSSVAICTDSSSLLPESDAERLGVIVVPIPVALDGAPFGGSADLFYDRLLAGARATTSQPSPHELAQAYALAAGRGAEHVLSVHLDGRLSGTVDAAELAARELPVPVTVVDTCTASFGVALCVRRAAAALAEEASAARAAAAARTLGLALRNAFVAPAARSRPGAEPAWSILELVDGVTRPVAVARDPAGAAALIARRATREAGPLRAAVGHAAAGIEAAASDLARLLGESPAITGIERYRLAPPVGAHTGALCFGAFWWPEAG